MATLDIFHQDAFTMLQLTAAVERNPYLPTGIGTMDIFEDQPIRTTALAVEERAGVLTLVPVSDRGSPPVERVNELRDLRYFETKRLAKAFTVTASDIQNIRQFGMESETMQVQAEVARRLSGPTGIERDIEYTWENQRLGAISGQLIDADGSTVLCNWFTQFGISAPAEIAFNLLGWQAGAGTPTSDGALRILCNQTVRAIKRAAKGAFIDGVTKVMAMCGDQFWDELVTHPDVAKTFLNWQQAVELRKGTAFQGGEGAPQLDTMSFGGIEWFNYRGSDDATTVGVPTTKVKFFLSKAPSVFRVAWAPAEFGPYVNTLGKKKYIIPIFDRDRQAWWRAECYSYPLFICTRPDTLFSGRAGT